MAIEDLGFVAVMRQAGLSNREAQIGLCVARGLVDKEIARTLAISCGTVRWYERRCREKLGAKNRAELAAKAVDL